MKFKLGDHVRVIAHPSHHFNQVGTVTDIDLSMHFPYRVTGLEESSLWFGPHELVLTERDEETP